MTDQRVEGEGNHGCDRDTFGTGTGVEDFGGDYPGERSAGTGEGEIVQPGHDDETPGGADVLVGGGWKASDEDTGNDECKLWRLLVFYNHIYREKMKTRMTDHVEQITPNQRPSSSQLVNEQNTARFSD